MAPRDPRRCGEESGETGKRGAESDADDAECRDAEPQYHQNVNNDLGLYPVKNGLSKRN